MARTGVDRTAFKNLRWHRAGFLARFCVPAKVAVSGLGGWAYDLVQTGPQWCCRRLRCDPGSTPDQLLTHFLLQLGNEFLYAKHPSGEEAVTNLKIATRVEELVKSTEPPTWERAYEIERLVVYLRPHSKLIIETDRRVAESEGLHLPSAAKYARNSTK